MITKNKEFEYRGYRFNIKVEQHHTGQCSVTVNDMGVTNYYTKIADISPDNVILVIATMETETKHWVDKRELVDKTDLEIGLTNLGFK